MNICSYYPNSFVRISNGIAYEQPKVPCYVSFRHDANFDAQSYFETVFENLTRMAACQPLEPAVNQAIYEAQQVFVYRQKQDVQSPRPEQENES